MTDPRIARTLAKVLAATYELLTETGFEHVTIEDISERSGVSRSTLYRHWDTKDDMLRDAFAAHAVGTEADGPDLRTALRRWTWIFAEGMTQTWGLAMVTVSVSGLTDPEQHATQQAWYRSMVDAVGTILARAGSDLNPGEVTSALVAPLLHRYLLSRESVDQAYAHALADAVCDGGS